jgi:hypothetical protein
MSKLQNRIENLQSKTTSTAVLEACNEAINKIQKNQSFSVSAAENQMLESEVISDLVESLSKVEDEAAKQFVSMVMVEKRVENLDNLGVKKAVAAIRESSIVNHPAFTYVFEKVAAMAKQPEWMVIESAISALTPFNWDATVNECLIALTENADKYREEIKIYSIVENLKKSSSSYLLPSISNLLESYLTNRGSSERVRLMERASQFLFDPHVKSLHNFLAESERAFHVATNDNSCTVNRVYSPIVLSEACEYFIVEGQVYKKFEDTISIANEEEINALPESFKAVAEILSWDNTVVSEGNVKVYSGDKIIEVTESEVKINGHAVTTSDIHKVYLNSGVFKMNERKHIDAIFVIKENWNTIFEMDMVKTIKSKVDPAKTVSIFFVGENIYINKSNRMMNENVFYKNCTAIQTKNLVMEYMKTDISSTFSQLLNEEEKQIKEANRLKEEFIQAINYLNEQRQKLESAVASIGESQEIKDLISAIDEEISFVKAEYSKVSAAQTSATTISEGMGVNVGDEATLGKKK